MIFARSESLPLSERALESKTSPSQRVFRFLDYICPALLLSDDERLHHHTGVKQAFLCWIQVAR